MSNIQRNARPLLLGWTWCDVAHRASAAGLDERALAKTKQEKLTSPHGQIQITPLHFSSLHHNSPHFTSLQSTQIRAVPHTGISPTHPFTHADRLSQSPPLPPPPAAATAVAATIPATTPPPLRPPMLPPPSGVSPTQNLLSQASSSAVSTAVSSHARTARSTARALRLISSHCQGHRQRRYMREWNK